MSCDQGLAANSLRGQEELPQPLQQKGTALWKGIIK